MRKTLFILVGLLFLPTLVFAQFTTFQGGTGNRGVSEGSILFGTSVANIRMGTSSALQWNNTASRLSFTFGSTTALSATTLCLTGDSCITSWPTGGGSGFSTTSTDFWKTQRDFFSTTSANYLLSTIDKGFFFSTTSANYWETQQAPRGSGFSSTSAEFFVHSSTTIPKTYTSNSFSATQTFGALVTLNNASSTIISATTLCLSSDCRTTWPAGGGGSDPNFSIQAGVLAPTTTIPVNFPSTLSIQSWKVATSTVVCTTGQCQYSDIQSAVDAGATDIKVKAGIYTLSAPVIIDEDAVKICGEGDVTEIRFNGTTVPVAFRSDGVITNSPYICDMKITSTTAGSGVGIDIGKFKHGTFENLRIVDVNIGAQGTTTSTFYNNFNNLRIEPEGSGNACYYFSNSANKNEIHDGRCFPSTTASTTGVILDATGTVVQGIDISDAGIAIDIQDQGANSSIEDVWMESNYTGIKLAYGVENIDVGGGTHNVSCHTICVNDLGAKGFRYFALESFDPVNYYSGENINFGIGTSSPQERLDLFSTTTKSLLYIRGGGSDFIQSGIRLDSSATIRGAGVYTYDDVGDIMWYFGEGYNRDAFLVNRRPLATTFNTDAANPDDADTTNLFSVLSTGASTTALVVSNLNAASCDVKASASGVLSCGTDATGAGGSGGAFSTTTSTVAGQLIVYPNNSATDIVAIGNTATTSAEYYFDPNTNTARLGNAASGDAVLQLGPASNEWSFGYDETDKTFAIASSTTLGTSNAVAIDKNLDTSFSGDILPAISDGSTVGSTANQFSDLFLAEGGIINWDSGDLTLTQAGNVLIIGGATQFRPSVDNGASLGTAIARWSELFASNASTSLLSTNYASSTEWRGGGLVADCDADAQTLGWDTTTGQFTCGDDDSGGGGASFGQGLELVTSTILAPTTTNAGIGIRADFFHATSTTGTTTISGALTMDRSGGQNILSIIPQGDIGSASAPVRHGSLVVDNTLNTRTPGLYISSDQNGVPDNPLTIIRSSQSGYNQGLLWLLGASTNTGGAAYGIRVQDGNPDIEFDESDQTAPIGRYEIDVNDDALRMNGRNALNSSYESIATFTRFDKDVTGGGGRFCLGCGFVDLPSSTFNIVGTTTQGLPYFTVSSASTTAATGDKVIVRGNGSWALGVGVTNTLNSFASMVNNNFSRLFTVATSTTANPLIDVGASTLWGKNWARVSVGTTTQSGVGANWPFTVQGEIYSTKRTLFCENVNVLMNLAADSTQGICGGFMFDEDAQAVTARGTDTLSSAIQVPAVFMFAGSGTQTAPWTQTAAAGDGAGITMPGAVNQAWAYASSSPAFEALVSATSTNATSTMFVVGFGNATGPATDYSIAPTNGFFFTASSTAATGNWYAVAGETSGTRTFVDTGIASSASPSLTTPVFQRMRIRVVPDLTTGVSTGFFYIDETLVATIATTGSTYNGFTPLVSVGKVNAGLAVGIYVSYIRAWSDLVPGQRN